MKTKISSYLQAISELVDEIERYEYYEDLLVQSLQKAEKNYLAKRYSYSEYDTIKNKILRGKNQEEILDYYHGYIYGLIKKIELLNAQVFKEFSQTDVLADIKAHANPKPITREKPVLQKISGSKAPVAAVQIKRAGKPPTMHEEKKLHIQMKKEAMLEIDSAISQIQHEMQVEKKKGFSLFDWLFGRTRAKPALQTAPLQKKQDVFSAFSAKKQYAPASPKELRPQAPVEDKTIVLKQKKETKSPISETAQTTFNVHTANFWQKIIRVFFNAKKPAKTGNKAGKEEVFSKSTSKTTSLLDLAPPEVEIVEEDLPQMNKNLLEQESKRIKNILLKEKEVGVYKASSIGAIANNLTRKISIYLLEQFPDFFRYLYNALRSANIKILSNTYLNIMILATLVAGALGFIGSMLFFLLKETPLTITIFNSVMIALVIAISTFAGLYSYPFSMIKQRRREINSALPFAINHMSAVTGAGVPPTAMFRLISESDEYGCLGEEIKKIVEYIDIFGYDLVTAVKSVASTTPSETFKEFLEGMVSSIETGGDLKQYLREKTDESMLTYNLERQKYVETISTYSDIYTGILIAAPLFFVVALSLVAILGGQIAGMDVKTLIVIGTYAFIPLINILFLLFLESTQPDV